MHRIFVKTLFTYLLCNVYSYVLVYKDYFLFKTFFSKSFLNPANDTWLYQNLLVITYNKWESLRGTDKRYYWSCCTQWPRCPCESNDFHVAICNCASRFFYLILPTCSGRQPGPKRGRAVAVMRTKQSSLFT